jgi:GDPmannose 4,6-dehydratase
MTRAFITGISGQDGSYLADRLVGESVDVHGLIRGWDADAHALHARHPGITLHEGDLANPALVAGLIADLQPDEIYNLAGITSVAQSWSIPVETGIVTGIAVAGILDAALTLSERGTSVRVFQASSSEIFGVPTESPQSETTPISPNSPYGAAKAYAATMVDIYRSRGLAVASCILYNHESPRRPESFVTRKITASAARIAAGLQDSLELGNLDVERDWGWAPDYVDAIVRATRHGSGDDYVIATGQSHSIREFAEAAFSAAGISDWERYVSINPEFVRPAEISTMLGDASKAREQLGWTPTVDFATLVTRMVEADVASIAADADGTAGHGPRTS